jgi:hypothetical protein
MRSLHPPDGFVRGKPIPIGLEKWRTEAGDGRNICRIYGMQREDRTSSEYAVMLAVIRTIVTFSNFGQLGARRSSLRESC